MKEDMSDGAVRYAFLRYTIGNVNKFVYLSWCGEGVTGMLKGRFNQHVKVFMSFRPLSSHCPTVTGSRYSD